MANLYKQDGSQVSTSALYQGVTQASNVVASRASSLAQSFANTLEPVVQYADKRFQEELKVRSEVAVAKAVEDATIAVTPNQYINDLEKVSGSDTVYERAYKEAYGKRIEANITTKVQSDVALLAQQHGDDLPAFQSGLANLNETIKQEYSLDGTAYALFTENVMNEATRYLPSVTAKSYQREKDNQFAAENEILTSVTNTALNGVRSGNLDKLPEDRLNLATKLNQMIEDGFINESDKIETLSKFDKEVESQFVLGSVERDLEKGNIADAKAQVEAWSSNPEVQSRLSPDEIDAEKNKAFVLINRKENELKQAAKAFVNVNKGSMLYNQGGGDYKNKDDVKGVDALIEQTFPDGVDYTNLEQRNIILDVAAKTGIVPTSFESYVRSSLYNVSDPEASVQAATVFTNLVNKYPQFVNQFSEKDIEYATDVQALITSGYDATSALTMVKDNQALDNKARYEYNKKTFKTEKDYTKDVNKIINELGDNADKSGWFDTDVQFTDETIAFVTNDADTIFKANLHKYSTVDAARQATVREMTNKWGVTYNKGKAEFTAYPPERVVLKTSEYSDDNWVSNQKTQVIRSLRTQGVKGDVKFIATPAVKAGIPQYQVMAFDEDLGIYNPVIVDGRSLKWMPNKETYDKRVKEEQISKARAKHKQPETSVSGFTMMDDF